MALLKNVNKCIHLLSTLILLSFFTHYGLPEQCAISAIQMICLDKINKF